MTDKPERIGSELDLLMSLDPLLMSDQDIDKIIEYERRQRLEFEMGVKTPKKDKGIKIDIGKTVAALTAGLVPTQTIQRRKL